MEGDNGILHIWVAQNTSNTLLVSVKHLPVLLGSEDCRASRDWIPETCSLGWLWGHPQPPRRPRGGDALCKSSQRLAGISTCWAGQGLAWGSSLTSRTHEQVGQGGMSLGALPPPPPPLPPVGWGVGGSPGEEKGRDICLIWPMRAKEGLCPTPRQRTCNLHRWHYLQMRFYEVYLSRWGFRYTKRRQKENGLKPVSSDGMHHGIVNGFIKEILQ